LAGIAEGGEGVIVEVQIIFKPVEVGDDLAEFRVLPARRVGRRCWILARAGRKPGLSPPQVSALAMASGGVARQIRL